MDVSPDIKVIYENDDMVAVNKPAGVLVHRPEKGPKAGQKEDVLTDWIKERYPEAEEVGDEPVLRPGIVHRLDEDTSGIILIAKNQSAFDYLKGLFQNHEVKKTYLALVHGRMAGRGRIEKPIGLKSGSVKRSVSAPDMKMVKDAVTEYRVLKLFKTGSETLTLLEVTPLTGRTHQIRVHLASIGHPIVGDRLYGRPKADKEIGLGRQFLHAAAAEFPLPDGSRMKIEADLPEDLQEFLVGLGPGEEREEVVEYD